MTGFVGFVDDTGGGYANEKMLDVIKSAGENQGWVTLRYDTTLAIRELIMRGPGLSGDQQIFVGFRAYRNNDADYYNISVAGFTGYVASNSFVNQPGYFESGIPAHNKRVDYWMNVNPQRFVFALKVGTPVYMHGYVGYLFPQATPNQYPYPLLVAGMLNGIPATRYSDTSITFGYRGSQQNMKLRFLDGTWKTYATYPWSSSAMVNDGFTGASFKWNLRDINNNYSLLPIVLRDANGVYGRLDGVYQISGFNRTTEDTGVVSGKNVVLIQDSRRTDFADYIALEI